MARPTKARRICMEAAYDNFCPNGVLAREKVIMTMDEYETIRLVDLEKCTHEQCAKQMGIARTTVTEIYESARYKMADSIVNGKTLEISGGNYRLCDGTALFCCNKICRRTSTSVGKDDIQRKETDQMRIAVTYENGEIFQHFGHTEQFKLYDIENSQVVRSQIVDTNGQGHGALYALPKTTFTGDRRHPVNFSGSYKTKTFKLLAALIVIIAAAYFVGTLLSSPIINASKYQKLMKVEKSKFTKDIDQISYDQIPLLDKSSAEILGARKMGSLVDLASQFEVADEYMKSFPDES